MLKCPKCNEKLYKQDHVYCCQNHHSFDIAKRGYCNLLMGNRTSSGDDKDMVRARTNFLQQGYYEPLRKCLIEMIKTMDINIMVDAGCGEGYYTNEIKEYMKNIEIYGFDLSKSAIDEACKAKNDVHYFVSSVFHMPIENTAVDLILSIFAPIHELENKRILKRQGYFLKVEPGPVHLHDLKTILYDEVYENEAEAVQYSSFKLMKQELLTYEITLSSAEHIRALFQMTPYYWKTSRQATQRLYALDELTTKVQFHIELYQVI